jgi:hypothetical protein
VRHAGVANESTIYNSNYFRLQKSNDGNVWTDVDTVDYSLANVTDREITPQNARYWRLYITKPALNTDNTARVYELELYTEDAVTPSTGADLALRMPTLVDSIYSLGYEGCNSVDGNSSTRWSSNNHFTSYPHWIQVDMQTEQTINRVDVNWEFAYASDYNVQISTDGLNWINVDTITGKVFL